MAFINDDKIIEHYNPNDYDRPSVTVDCVLLSSDNNKILDSSKAKHKNSTDDYLLKILLVKRAEEPYKNYWSLPGTFVSVEETFDDAIYRLMTDKLSLSLDNYDFPYIEQLYTFDEIHRDPRMRIISVAYMVLFNSDNLPVFTAGSNIEELEWFYIVYDEEDKKYWFVSDNYRISLEDIAFDHKNIIQKTIERISNKIEYTDIAFNLLPDLFTLGQVQSLYEYLLHKKVDKSNFRKFIKKFVVETEQYEENVSHRPARLYKLNNDWKNIFWR